MSESSDPLDKLIMGVVEESFVAEEFKKKAKLYDERNALYGDNYKRFGFIMVHLFPSGAALNGPHDFNRMGIFVQIVSKVTRYAAQFEKGGHADSLDDLSVYAMMLKELDAIIKEEDET